ncbi:MAG TPA: glycosyltransferase family 4 protein [Baekduia sp.]|jgi:glycosyltransferase involved in cell wall biosynthesis
MAPEHDRLRVLQTFPHKIGAARICDTAWHQAEGVQRAGADLLVMTGAVHRPLPDGIRVRTTLARGKVRIPYRPLGRMRAMKLHDHLVARALPRLAGEIDVVHAWPLGALETLRVARRLGIPTVLERPNAHTRFAYEAVRDECERLGVVLPPDHEHAFNEAILEREEAEYDLADALLCPSDFVVKTFLDQGASPERLVRHLYGFDEQAFQPRADRVRFAADGLTVLFAGVCAVRKGLHFALEAWVASPASEHGRFLIAGEFLPEYQEKLSGLLAHPSVEVLGHRTDLPVLMADADVLVLPSIEEGFGLVCVEAMGAGAVPMISDACTDVCVHDENGFVHHVGDVAAIAAQFTALHEDPALLARLRAGALRTAPEVTWDKAGERLVEVYGEVVAAMSPAQAPRRVA